MMVPVVYDVTRLLLRSVGSGPNGIDRVDLNLARHFLRVDNQRNQGLLLHRLRPIVLDNGGARNLLSVVDAAWEGESDLAADEAYQLIRRWIIRLGIERGPAVSRVVRATKPRIVTTVRLASVLMRALPWFRPVPRNAVFIHGTQFPSMRLFNWLDRRPDVKPVFFVHDLLPFLHPEYFTGRNVEQHRRFLEVFVRYASAAIVNTEAVKSDLVTFLESRGSKLRPILVAPMPAESLFALPSLADDELQTNPYFVMCGTIEPRKNHALILDLWETLVRQYGNAAPRLVVMGKRGWNNTDVFKRLDHTPWVRSHIVEATGLTSQAIASIVANARALLMPSIAEGYGLPIVEARAAGTSVIASDIGVFREIAGREITFCSLEDRSAWLAAIARCMSPTNVPRLSKDNGREASAWSNYFCSVDTFINSI